MRTKGHEATDGRAFKLREEIAAGYLGEGGGTSTGFDCGQGLRGGSGKYGEKSDEWERERGDTCEEVARIKIRVPETA